MKKYVLFLPLFLSIFPNCWAGKPFETSQWQTKNGTRVVFYEAMEVPMLDISIAFSAGSAYDGKNFGLSSLTTRLINQGNNGLQANIISEKLAEIGAQYEAVSNQNMAAFNIRTLVEPSSLKKAVTLFSSIINQPDFPLDSFNREKNQLLIAIAQAQESPDLVANQVFFHALYQQHPYGHPVIGTQKTVKKLTVEQVRSFYRQFFVGSNAVMVLVGAIDKPTAEKIAEQITQHLPKGHPAFDITAQKPMRKALSIIVPFPSSQTILRIGQLGITHQDKDYFPLIVGNYMLGGSTIVSTLGDELRIKRGLTYGVYSQFSPMPGKGPFLINFSTQNNQTQEAVKITKEALLAFLKNPPNEQELLEAKQYLTGSFPLALASNRSIADMLLKIAFYHLPDNYLQTYIEHINAVTALQIQDSFQKLITPNLLLEVAVGKIQ